MTSHVPRSAAITCLFLCAAHAVADDGLPRVLGVGAGPARLVAVLANDADAASSALWRWDAGAQPHRVATFEHAPGAVPRATVDATGNAWLVVADGPARDGQPARLVVVDRDGHTRTAMQGLPLPQAPVALPGGGVMVFTGHESTGWTLHHATSASRVVPVMSARGAWVVPVSSDAGPCLVAQDGWNATLRCRDGARAPTDVATWKDAMVRDAALRGGMLSAVELRRSGATLVVGPPAGARNVATAREPLFAPVRAGAATVFSAGVGGGLGVVEGGKAPRFMAVMPGRRMVPLVANAEHVVARADAPDGRQAPSFHLVHVLDGAVEVIPTGTSIVEMAGVLP